MLYCVNFLHCWRKDFFSLFYYPCSFIYKIHKTQRKIRIQFLIMFYRRIFFHLNLLNCSCLFKKFYINTFTLSTSAHNQLHTSAATELNIAASSSQKLLSFHNVVLHIIIINKLCRLRVLYFSKPTKQLLNFKQAIM
jgi:hypothetical protein